VQDWQWFSGLILTIESLNRGQNLPGWKFLTEGHRCIPFLTFDCIISLHHLAGYAAQLHGINAYKQKHQQPNGADQP
jgi:hypothetical protein